MSVHSRITNKYYFDKRIKELDQRIITILGKAFWNKDIPSSSWDNLQKFTNTTIVECRFSAIKTKNLSVFSFAVDRLESRVEFLIARENARKNIKVKKKPFWKFW